MSAKTTKGHDAAEDAVETEDVLIEEEEPAVKATARKKVRRVRVVEIIDDEDLDEVLDQLDAQEAEEEEEEAEKPRSVKKAPAPEEPDGAAPRGPLLSPLVRTVAAIVVIAALASFGLFEWRQASDLSAKQEVRRQIEAKLTEFGGAVGTYDTSNVKASQDKIASYMVGDALSVFQANAAKAQTLTDPSKAKVTTVSKARQVIVGNVNGEFATGLIAVDITLTTDQGSAPMSNNYLVIDLVRQKGVWKVSKLTPIGSPSDSGTDGTTGTIPGTSATPTPTPTK
ncbi:MAG: hypothetical protein JWN52_2834 [Actinomycetia bacterium]|nr:hypothetical protein [Actinomycetes bacterium]